MNCVKSMCVNSSFGGSGHSFASTVTKKHNSNKLFVQIDMPRLPEFDRNRAIGLLQEGTSQRDVATTLIVHINSIFRLWNRFQVTGSTRDRRRIGRPRVSTARQDRFIHHVHAQKRFLAASATARNIPGLRPITGESGWVIYLKRKLKRLITTLLFIVFTWVFCV